MVKTSWRRRLRRSSLGLLQYLPNPCVSRLMWWTQAKFLVAVAVVAFRQNEVLLLRHSYRTRHPWGVVTGYVGYGETLEEAGIREFYEETGYRLAEAAALALVDLRFVGRHHLEAVYRVRSNLDLGQGLGPSSDGEIERGTWQAVDRLPEDLLPDQRRLIFLADRARNASANTTPLP